MHTENLCSVPQNRRFVDPAKRLEIRLLAVLGEREDNDGVFEFRTWDARRRPGGDYSDIEDFEMGAVAVAVSNNRDM